MVQQADSSLSLVRTCRRLAGRLFDRVVWKIDGLFDYRFGTETTGLTSLKSLGVTSPSVEQAKDYEATPNRLFRKCISMLLIDHRRFSFVDLGSGKGRALLLASEFPFRQIIGVELSEKLHEVAERNIKAYRNPKQRTSDIRSVCMDARQFEFPEGDIVLFLSNPFGSEIMSEVMANLKSKCEADRSRLAIVYVEAHQADVIERSGLVAAKRRVDVPLLIPRRPTAFTNVMLYSNDPTLIPM
jgi:predicted RNA methylase